jgi:flagellar hook-basal body complex protein FliE
VDKTLIAQTVANKLFSSEKALDAAIAETAALLTGVAEARMEARVSMVATDASTAKIMQALSLLSEARTAMAEAHVELDHVKTKIGVRTKMIGAFDKPEAPATQQLTRVA